MLSASDGGDTDDDPPRRACKFSKAGVVAKITGFAYGTTKNDETTVRVCVLGGGGAVPVSCCRYCKRVWMGLPCPTALCPCWRLLFSDGREPGCHEPLLHLRW